MSSMTESVMDQNKHNIDKSQNERPHFVSKLLLFGEYSVIKNSMALAMPYPAFKGRLSFPHGSKGKSIDQEFKSLSLYIKKNLVQLENLSCEFDLPSFNFDISQGLEFDSSIPVGYGVGSSGAICAALFDYYGKLDKSQSKDDLFLLKKIFSFLEGHFHGASSGIDPLISYLGQAILIKKHGELVPVILPRFKEGNGAIFLVNTERARRTEPLVNLFLEKCKSDKFSSICDSELLPITNNCITSFIEQDIDSLWSSFVNLSKFQLEYFTPMIPKLYIDVWEEGLRSNEFAIKLCGAGGGGFLLGMTKDFKKTYEKLDAFNIKPIFRF